MVVGVGILAERQRDGQGPQAESDHQQSRDYP
jgi:hypothetical protein